MEKGSTIENTRSKNKVNLHLQQIKRSIFRDQVLISGFLLYCEFFASPKR